MSSTKGKEQERTLAEDAVSQPVPPDDPAPGARAVRIAIVAVVLSVSAVFLFARLGHYALWDDECLTALPALNVWRVGDTSLVFGRNILAHREGAMMTDLHDRSYQPLMFYLAAPSLGLLGQNAWAARLPFALCGMACVALMLRWAWRERVGPVTWVLVALAILGNVSFFLYSRNCRYYAPGLLFTVAVAYVYRFYDGRRRSIVALSLLSLALLATNMLYYVALNSVLVVDYAIWGRRRTPLSMTDWLWLLVPQVLVGVPLLVVWNPWRSAILDVLPHENWFSAKSTLFYRHFRDLNRCEFGVLPLIALAPLLYLPARWEWLLRAPMAVFVYVTTATILSPQPVSLSPTADVRYLVPVIPLCMAVGVLALSAVARESASLALALGLLAFGTNMLNLDPSLRGGFRSTVCDYIGELVHPPGDPYSVTASWLNEHVEPGKSVCVLPLFMTYPLMFHAPAPVYAWQLPPSSEDRFKGLEPIHFQGKLLPDYFVAFGPAAEAVRRLRPGDPRIRYEQIETLDFLWKDLYRPELFWRTFRPITGYDRSRHAIYIFRKSESLVF